MPIVVDALIALAWCFEDKSSEYSEAALDLLPTEGAVAPAFWMLEVGNALVAAERRRRISDVESSRFLSRLQALPIEIDYTEVSASVDDVLYVARKHELTLYDACYVELALRRELELYSADARLRKGAEAAGVKVFRSS